jgi:hypothetical protein
MNLIFKNSTTLQRMHEGPLGPYLDSYAADMHQQGYAPPTAESQIRLVADFSRWLAKRQIIPQEITIEHCQHYLRFRARHRCPGRSDLGALVPFLVDFWRRSVEEEPYVYKQPGLLKTRLAEIEQCDGQRKEKAILLELSWSLATKPNADMQLWLEKV